ncbi:hypothetical protein [Pedobacter sp.]|uniref:hypothetical protein n=1 Tax=Pedobacter sp. TaxID=1411316 RepID=UPI002D7EAFC1|nr:hypothetical protein [Pedobacter sp.]
MKDEKKIEYVEYVGRQVPKKDFRVFVYGEDDKRRLCNSYEEYEKAVKSREWFTTVDELKPKGQKNRG